MDNKLVIALSSRALFNLDESHRIFEESGFQTFREHQRAMENVPLPQGPAFALAQKCLNINKLAPKEEPLVEIILLSRNTVDTGLRIFNSVAHYELGIHRAVFAGGESPYKYSKAIGAHLYLSMNQADVKQSIQDGCAAGAIWSNRAHEGHPDQLRFAFDGDAVLFSDEAERIFQTEGLEAFYERERHSRNLFLDEGPLKPFLEALHNVQKVAPDAIRTALVTARSPEASERVIRTLRNWEIDINEAFFLAGQNKAPYIEEFGADIFFDDNHQNCEQAREKVTTCNVPYGINNQ